jgi:hypothetical protein
MIVGLSGPLRPQLHIKLKDNNNNIHPAVTGFGDVKYMKLSQEFLILCSDNKHTCH